MARGCSLPLCYISCIYLDLLKRDLEAEGLVVIRVEGVLLDCRLLLLQPLSILHQVDLHVRICGDTLTLFGACFPTLGPSDIRETRLHHCLHQSANLPPSRASNTVWRGPEWSAPSVLSLSLAITARRRSPSSSFVGDQQKLPKKIPQKTKTPRVPRSRIRVGLCFSEAEGVTPR